MVTNAHSSTSDDRLLSVIEVAGLLGVHVSTVRRWIASGKLPAYRVGGKGVRVQYRDVFTLVRPLRSDDGGNRVQQAEKRVPPLTPDEQQRGFEALAELRRLRADALENRGGIPYPESSELLAQERDARICDLTQALQR